jgi:hypothetical protein
MDQPFAELEDMKSFLCGGDEGVEFDEKLVMRIVVSAAVGFIIAIFIVFIIYIVVNIYGSSGFASFRQRRSKQSTAYKVQPHRHMEPMHSFAIESENADLDPRMARPEMMMDYDEDRLRFDNFAGFSDKGLYDQMPSYQQNLTSSSRLPNMPNEYTPNNSDPMLENILYER